MYTFYTTFCLRILHYIYSYIYTSILYVLYRHALQNSSNFLNRPKLLENAKKIKTKDIIGMLHVYSIGY